MQTTIDFLGHRISLEGMEMDLEKLEVLWVWQPPCQVKDMQQLFGFVNYYHTFIPQVAALNAPLSNLLQKGVKFHWGMAEQDDFDVLIIEASQSGEAFCGKDGCIGHCHRGCSLASLRSFGYPVPLCLLLQKVVLNGKDLHNMGQGTAGHEGGL